MSQTVCDHIFCEACIEPCFACPTCRTALTPSDRKPLIQCNRPLLRMMHDLKVWCPYHSESKMKVSSDSSESTQFEGGQPAPKTTPTSEVGYCDWTGSYTDLLARHLNECDFHIVPCPRGCGKMLCRLDLSNHDTDCAKKFEECSICKELLKCGMMSEHRKEKAELHVQLLESKLSEKEALKDSWKHQVQTKIVHWDVCNVDQLLRSHPKGSSYRSPDFFLAGYGPIHFELFPNGDHRAAPGKVSLYVYGPAEIKVKARLSIGHCSSAFEQFELITKGFGFINFCDVPTTKTTTVILELLEVAVHLTSNA